MHALGGANLWIKNPGLCDLRADTIKLPRHGFGTVGRAPAVADPPLAQDLLHGELCAETRVQEEAPLPGGRL